MRGQTIGKTMKHGFAGSVSRQPDAVIDTHPLEGSAIAFGAPLVYGTNGAVKEFGETDTAATFLGVAVREVKSATNFLNQNVGMYQPGEAVPVMKRGCINVICQNGTPVMGGTVYIRTKTNEAYPNAKVGGFEATGDSTNSVALANARWKGSADADGVAEIRILTANNA